MDNFNRRFKYFCLGEKLANVQYEIKRDLLNMYNTLFVDDVEIASSAEKIKDNFEKYLNGN
jgi:hypothetical protein